MATSSPFLTNFSAILNSAQRLGTHVIESLRQAELEPELRILFAAGNTEEALGTFLNQNYAEGALLGLSEPSLTFLLNRLQSDLCIKMVADMIQKPDSSNSRRLRNWINLLKKPSPDYPYTSQFGSDLKALESIQNWLQLLPEAERLDAEMTQLLSKKIWELRTWHARIEMRKAFLKDVHASFAFTKSINKKIVYKTAEGAALSIINFLYREEQKLPKYLFDYLSDQGLQNIDNLIQQWNKSLNTYKKSEGKSPQITLYTERLINLGQYINQHRYLKNTLELETEKAITAFQESCDQLAEAISSKKAVEECKEQYSHTLKQLDIALTDFWANCAAARFDSYVEEDFETSEAAKQVEQALHTHALWTQQGDKNVYARLQNFFDEIEKANSTNVTPTGSQEPPFNRFLNAEIERALFKSGLDKRAYEQLTALAADELSIEIAPELEEGKPYLVSQTPESEVETNASQSLLQNIGQALKTFYTFSLKVFLAPIRAILAALRALYQKISKVSPSASSERDASILETDEVVPEPSEPLIGQTSVHLENNATQIVEKAPAALGISDQPIEQPIPALQNTANIFSDTFPRNEEGNNSVLGNYLPEEIISVAEFMFDQIIIGYSKETEKKEREGLEKRVLEFKTKIDPLDEQYLSRMQKDFKYESVGKLLSRKVHASRPLPIEKNINIAKEFIMDSDRAFIDVIYFDGKEYHFRDENGDKNTNLSTMYPKHKMATILRKFCKNDEELFFLSNIFSQSGFFIDLSEILTFSDEEYIPGQCYNARDKHSRRFASISLERISDDIAKVVLNFRRDQITQVVSPPDPSAPMQVVSPLDPSASLPLFKVCDPNSFFEWQLALEINVGKYDKRVSALRKESFCDFKLLKPSLSQVGSHDRNPDYPNTSAIEEEGAVNPPASPADSFYMVDRQA